MKITAQIPITLVFMQACGTGQPTQTTSLEKMETKEQVADAGTSNHNESATATAQQYALSASQVVTVINQFSTALDFLDLIPTYQCGESRRTFVGRVVPKLQSEIGCVTVATTEEPTRDLIVLSFASTGCKVEGHTLSGDISVAYSGGEDRFDMMMDVSKVKIDGRSIPAQIGYATCGDETRYWASARGILEKSPETSYDFTVQVGIRDGLPLIGSKSYIFNGMGNVATAKGADTVTVNQLEYSVGDLFPSKGSLRIATAKGSNVTVKFDQTLWRLGTAEITVDQNAPVTLPLVR